MDKKPGLCARLTRLLYAVEWGISNRPFSLGFGRGVWCTGMPNSFEWWAASRNHTSSTVLPCGTTEQSPGWEVWWVVWRFRIGFGKPWPVDQIWLFPFLSRYPRSTLTMAFKWLGKKKIKRRINFLACKNYVKFKFYCLWSIRNTHDYSFMYCL